MVDDFDDTKILIKKHFKKTYLEIQKKLNSLSTKGHSFLLGRMYFIGDDCFQNMFIYQPTYNWLKLKKASSSLQYVNGWILKEAYHNFKLVLISGAQAPIIIRFEYKQKLDFNSSALVAQPNN